MNKCYVLLFIIMLSCKNEKSNTEIFYYPSGEKNLEIFRTDGGKSVRFEYYFKNGNKQKTIFEYESKLNGEMKYFRENGQLEQHGNYVNGKPHGFCEFYDLNGNLYEKVMFVNGEKKEEFFYFDNTMVKTHYTFDKDTLPVCVERFDNKGILKEVDITPIIRIEKTKYKVGNIIKVFYKLPVFNEKYLYRIHTGLSTSEAIEKQDFGDEKIIPVSGLLETGVNFITDNSRKNKLFAFIVLKEKIDTSKMIVGNFVTENVELY